MPKTCADQYDKEWKLALGTLGRGNHFIEFAENLDGAVLHSGSRGVGKKIGMHYNETMDRVLRR